MGVLCDTSSFLKLVRLIAASDTMAKRCNGLDRSNRFITKLFTRTYVDQSSIGKHVFFLSDLPVSVSENDSETRKVLQDINDGV